MARSTTSIFYGKNNQSKRKELTRKQEAEEFVKTWSDPTRGAEDKDRQKFWIDLMEHVYGVRDYVHYLDFERDVLVNGNKKHIDVFIPSTKVMIEMKGRGKNLDDKIKQSDEIKLTPFEQAVRYSQHLPHKDNPRWILVSNFDEIRIYDMNKIEPEKEPISIQLKDLPNKVDELEFLINVQQQNIIDEKKLSVAAGNLVAKIYDELLNAYAQHADTEDKRIQQSLNVLIVRLVFLLYADDTGILGSHNMFQRFMANREPQYIRRDLIELFRVLNMTEEQREKYDPFLDDEFKQFSYVNGGMFADEDIFVPQFTKELKTLIVDEAGRGFDWSNISPTIFGAVFESTLNPETRRKGGMHYTSIENIHKVIDPLFLNELNAEMKKIRNMQQLNKRKQAAKEFQEKLGKLKFFDPACGSGNFLTESYLCLRRMENECLQIIYGNDSLLNTFNIRDIIKVHIQNFYGIEINDFAVSVARTAMWIAESQMFEETKNIVYTQDDFLPLDSNDSIYEGNALRMSWEDIVKPYELDYIMGNPPFIGNYLRTKDQQIDMDIIFKGFKSYKKIDYVACWYKKAAEYMKDSSISAAFVSTNSICQGISIIQLWRPLIQDYGLNINFAIRTFKWMNEATNGANVFCVVVGFSYRNKKKKTIEDHNSVSTVTHINPYLIDAPDVFINSRSQPISDIPEMRYGTKFTDDGELSNISDEKKKSLIDSGVLPSLFKHILGSREFINRNEHRWGLWLLDSQPSSWRKSTSIVEILQKVSDFRKKSRKAATRKLAEVPFQPEFNSYSNSDFLLVPSVSSQKRKYIPIGYFDNSYITTNACFLIPNANKYTFGIMTSIVHNAWMRVVAGRLKADYRYSNTIVYNTFPWPEVDDKQKGAISKTAQNILNARSLYPDSSLADLYDPLTMPIELRKAHEANDKAVLKAYGLKPNATEEEIVQHLFKMYEQLTKEEK